MSPLTDFTDRAAAHLKGQLWRARFWRNRARIADAALLELLGLLRRYAGQLPAGMLVELAAICARLAAALPDSDPAALDAPAPTPAHERVL